MKEEEVMLNVWTKYKECLDAFYKATKLAQELCKETEWQEFADDFDDEIDGYKLMELKQELENKFGSCPFETEFDQFEAGNH